MIWKQKKKRVYYGKLPTRTGWKDISLGTQDRDTAIAMQRMLDEFKHQRRWELIEAIGPRLRVGVLYDAYQRGEIDGLLARLKDTDLSARVQDWQRAILASAKVQPQTAAQYLAQIRTLIPEGKPFFASQATPELLDRWLNTLDVESSTRRRYFAAAQSFFGYLRRLKLIPVSPLRELDRPKDSEARADWWLAQKDMQRVCDASPEPYRTLFALMYGTGIEVSVACKLRRKDVDLKAREIFAPGTKTYNRKRTVRVSEWAWPYVEALCKDKLPDARLFPKMKRNAAWYQHDAVTKRLGFTGYQLRDSRHSYAVRAVKAGTPSEIVAKQLGHKDASMVHRVYGRFQPSSGEREKWERIAALQDEAQEEQK
jgi:integrase